MCYLSYPKNIPSIKEIIAYLILLKYLDILSHSSLLTNNSHLIADFLHLPVFRRSKIDILDVYASIKIYKTVFV